VPPRRRDDLRPTRGRAEQTSRPAGRCARLPRKAFEELISGSGPRQQADLRPSRALEGASGLPLGRHLESCAETWRRVPCRPRAGAARPKYEDGGGSGAGHGFTPSSTRPEPASCRAFQRCQKLQRRAKNEDQRTRIPVSDGKMTRGEQADQPKHPKSGGGSPRRSGRRRAATTGAGLNRLMKKPRKAKSPSGGSNPPRPPRSRRRPGRRASRAKARERRAGTPASAFLRVLLQERLLRGPRKGMKSGRR